MFNCFGENIEWRLCFVDISPTSIFSTVALDNSKDFSLYPIIVLYPLIKNNKKNKEIMVQNKEYWYIILALVASESIFSNLYLSY